jgi:hypothetical protein
MWSNLWNEEWRGGFRSIRRKPAPVQLLPPHSPHDMTSDPTQAGDKQATDRLICGTAWSSTHVAVIESRESPYSYFRANIH